MLLVAILGATALYAWKNNRQVRVPYALSVGRVEPLPSQAQKKTQEEIRSLNQDIVLSVAAFGLVTVSSVTNSLLAILALPMLVKLVIPWWQEGFQSGLDERKFDHKVFEAFLMAGLLAFGYYRIAAVLFGSAAAGKKLGLQTRMLVENVQETIFGDQPGKIWVVSSEGQEIGIPLNYLRVEDI
jgi:hypothetical protein